MLRKNTRMEERKRVEREVLKIWVHLWRSSIACHDLTRATSYKLRSILNNQTQKSWSPEESSHLGQVKPFWRKSSAFFKWALCSSYFLESKSSECSTGQCLNSIRKFQRVNGHGSSELGSLEDNYRELWCKQVPLKFTSMILWNFPKCKQAKCPIWTFYRAFLASTI